MALPSRARELWRPAWRRRLLTIAIVGFLTTLPLIGTLGYENAFVLAPFCALAGIAIGVDAVRRGEGRRAALGSALREYCELSGLAIAVLFVGRIWQRGCDPLGGLLFFAIGPFLSGLVGIVCGFWGGVLGHKRWQMLLVGAIPFLVSTAIGLSRLYFDPVIYAYDPFWGYYSGSVYDEAVSVTKRYGWFRAYNALGVAAALAAFWVLVDPRRLRVRAPEPSGRGVAASIGAAALAITTATIGINAPALGFTANIDTITEVLSQKRETEHFVIHYSPRGPDARSIEVIAAEHEYAWDRLYKIMGRAPDGKITSFVFNNRDQKRKVMGAGKVQVAAPWRKHIYLDHRGYPHRVLHHELVHVFGQTIGDSLFGVSRDGLRLNVGLIEGLASGVAPRAHDRVDLHDRAKILGELGKRPSLAAIMGPGFFAQSGSRAYTTAGSFCQWLIETRGFEKMATLYSSAGDFERAYGESLADLEAQWLAFLDAREGVTPQDVAERAEYFRRGAVFERPCAHRISEVRREIRRANNRGLHRDTLPGHRALCELEPENPAHRLGLAVGHALADDYPAARDALEATLAMEGITATLETSAQMNRGDVELASGRPEAAVEAYEAALDLPSAASMTRLLQLRLLGAKNPELAPLLLDYFSPFDRRDDGVSRAVARVSIAVAIRERAGYEALGDYLLARQLLNVQRPEAAVQPLRRSLERPAALPSVEFVRAARVALMSACVQTGRYDEARELLAALENEPGIGNGHKLTYEYWRGRIDFYERYFTDRG